MVLKCGIIASILVFAVIDWVASVSIYRDTDVLKKSDRSGRQFNALPLYEDEYTVSRYRDSLSQWESAEWPRQGARGDNSYDSEERPYDWFYYNKYLTNGRFNHLYNGPNNEDNAGMGEPGNSPPRVLPRPVPYSFGKSSKGKKLSRA